MENLQTIMTQAVDIYYGMRQILSPDSLNKQTRQIKEEIMKKFNLTEEEFNTEWNKVNHEYHKNHK